MSVIWRGYQHFTQGFARKQLTSYSIELTAEKAAKLWAKLKEWTGSQQDFYFKYVNPFRIRGELTEPRKRVNIKTARER